MTFDQLTPGMTLIGFNYHRTFIIEKLLPETALVYKLYMMNGKITQETQQVESVDWNQYSGYYQVDPLTPDQRSKFIKELFEYYLRIR